MKIYHFLSVVVLGLCSAAASATTIWQPTDGNVNYLQFGSTTTGGGDLAMFNTGGDMLLIGSSGGQVDINYTIDTASFNGNSISLGAGDYFTLGMSWDGGANWHGDSYKDPAGTNAYFVYFNDGSANKGSTLANDLAPVPVPAAAWLFGTGLLGLVGVARRRT